MSNGATYSVVPFVNQKSLGMVSGIVGAGGNLGALLFAFMFKSESITYDDAFYMIGIGACVIAVLSFFIKFPPEKKKEFVEIKSETESVTVETKKEPELILQ